MTKTGDRLTITFASTAMRRGISRRASPSRSEAGATDPAERATLAIVMDARAAVAMAAARGMARLGSTEPSWTMIVLREPIPVLSLR
jgi:hypothetical protein